MNIRAIFEYKYWFYWVVLIQLCYNISGLVLVGTNTGRRVGGKEPVRNHTHSTVLTALVLATLGYSTANGLFLILYDTQYTCTIFGSLAVQQGISIIITSHMIGGVFIYLWPSPDLSFYNSVLHLKLAGASAVLTLLTSTVLMYLVINRASNLKLSVSVYWFANTGDLSMNAPINLKPPTWRGSPRKTDINYVPFSKPVQWICSTSRKFIANSFTRRASPVESMSFTLFQNSFALAAIALLMVRVITLLSQLQNEDFLIRMGTEICPYAGNLSMLVGYPEDRQPDLPSDRSVDSLSFEVRFLKGTSGNMYDDISDDDQRTMYPIQYVIALRNTTLRPTTQDYPSLWFLNQPDTIKAPAENDPGINSIPFLSPALQPSPGLHLVTSLAQTKRRFIVSSGIHDAITGMKPKYMDVNFFPATSTSTLLNSNFEVCTTLNASLSYVACGYVLVPSGLTSHPTATQRQLNQKADANYCEVIEDYRQSSAFDVLGSIGGLLALLQGIHIFLFGRPLFWGVFGAKLLTPFGIVGNLVNNGLRQELQNYYHIRVSGNNENSRNEEEDMANAPGVTRFLLDYVLELGPVVMANRSNERQCDTESVRSAVELEDLGQSDQNQGNSTAEPLLNAPSEVFCTRSINVHPSAAAI